MWLGNRPVSGAWSEGRDRQQETRELLEVMEMIRMLAAGWFFFYKCIYNMSNSINCTL